MTIQKKKTGVESENSRQNHKCVITNCQSQYIGSAHNTNRTVTAPSTAIYNTMTVNMLTCAQHYFGSLCRFNREPVKCHTEMTQPFYELLAEMHRTDNVRPRAI